MTLAAALLVYATMLLAGFHAAARLWSEPLGARRLVTRAVLLGPAAVGLVALALVLLRLPPTTPAIVAPVLVVAALDRRRIAAAWGARDQASASAAERALLVLVAAVFACGLAEGLRVPIHRADEIHLYGLLGRILETRGAFDLEVLARAASDEGPFAHPPLLGLEEAAVFAASGDARAFAVKPLFALAWLGYALLVVECAFALARPRFAAPLALAFVLVPGFAANVVRGNADLAFTGLLLLAAVEARAWLVDPWCGARAALPWVAALSLAGLVKSEGAAVAPAAALLVALVGGARSGRPGRAGAFLLALVVCASSSAWIAWKKANGLDLQHVLGDAREGGALVTVLANLLRRARARRAHCGPVARLRRRPGGPVRPRAGLGGARGRRPGGRRGGAWRRVAPWLAVALAHFLLYAAVFASQGDRLAWQVEVAGDRVLGHLTPALLLLALAAVRERPPQSPPA